MSEVSTRNKANTIESIAIPVGAIVVGACLFGLAKGLSALANAALRASENKAITSKPQGMKSVAALRAESAPFELSFSANGSLETLKAQAFKQLGTQPFLVVNRAELETSVLALDRAKTPEEVQTAHRNIVAKLEGSHQQVFTTALLEAGKRAALKIGFKKIESLPSPIASMARFAATDTLGRTLVTEVNAAKDGNMKIETEVVGVSDGSCKAILDDFDKALEDEGVKSQTPNRKFTGGVCELAAVRKFLGNKVAPISSVAVKSESVASTDEAKKRARRLNQKQTLAQKRK